MAKYYFRLLLLFGSVIGFFALIGSLLPRSYEFASEIEINAPIETVFADLNALENWKSWSQWDPARIPDLTVTYSGPPAGEGSTQAWTEPRGSGKLWITKSTKPHELQYELLFANFPKMTSLMVLSEVEGKTKLRWSSRGKLPSGPFYGYFAPFFGPQLEGEYEQSLLRLKKKLELSGPE